MLHTVTDPRQVGDYVFARPGRIHRENRPSTAAGIGGAVGTGIGGVAGACAGVGLFTAEVVGTFGLFPSLAPELAKGSLVAPMYGVDHQSTNALVVLMLMMLMRNLAMLSDMLEASWELLEDMSRRSLWSVPWQL